MKKVTFNSVQYTSKFINANFRIKAHGLNALGEKINTLVGVSGAIALIGAELRVKFISRAIKAGLDKFVCKLRRGLVITLYSK